MCPLWTKIEPLNKITDRNYTAEYQKHQFYLGYQENSQLTKKKYLFYLIYFSLGI